MSSFSGLPPWGSRNETIREGEEVLLMYQSANRDESVFDEPDRFDITRENAREHLAFGSGTHFCMGANLARMEMRTAMNAVLDRLPGLRLDPDAEAPWVTGLMFRMPTALPVLWDA